MITLIFEEGVRNQVIARIVENTCKLATLTDNTVTDELKVNAIDILSNKTDTDLFAIDRGLSEHITILENILSMRNAFEEMMLKGGL